MNAAFLNEGLTDSVHSWEVQLVLEYCDKGSLRTLLNKQGTFSLAGACGRPWHVGVWYLVGAMQSKLPWTPSWPLDE